MKIKSIAFLILCSLLSFPLLNAQNVTITDDSTHSPHGSAMLDVYSLNKGFLMPRLTSSQRLSISSPATGLLVFDTDSNHFYFHNGTSWENLMSITDTSSGFWKLNASARNIFLADSLNKVGIGYSKPSAKLEVWGDTIHNATDTVPLFSVKDRKGNEVFVVYPKGVRVYVDTSVFSTAKTNVTTDVTGFRVGKKTGAGSKGNGEEYFTISPDFAADTFGSQARILWYPKKEAFMSGRVWVQSPDSVGTNSWASGYLSKSIGDYSQALGYSPRAIGDYSTAIGNYALAIGDNSFALGDSAVAGGGGGSKAANNYCYAFGKGTHAIGDGSYAFGRHAYATGEGGFAMGDMAQAQGSSSFVLGENSIASNTNSYAFGKYSQAVGSACFAFGDSVIAGTATKKNAYVFGKRSSATGDNSFVFGYKTVSMSTGAIAMGISDTASDIGTIALGGACHASQNYAFAAGYNCKAQGYASIAFGNLSKAASNYSVAIGSESNALGEASVALGSNNKSLLDYSFTVGRNSVADGEYAIALGDSCKSVDSYSISMGFNCKALKEASISIGYECKAFKLGSIAIGGLSQAKENSSIVIGSAAISYSAFETVIGLNNTSYSPVAPTGWNGSDRLFVIGNGWGSPSNAVTVLKNGNTGIGESNPSQKLHVEGNAIVNGVIYGQSSTGSGDVLLVGNDAKISDINVANTLAIYGQQNNAVAGIRLGSGGETLYGANGRIGTGTTSPLAKMHAVETTSGGTAVWGQTNGGNGIGVYGYSTGSGTSNYGVYGYAAGATNNWAGYFTGGNVYVANNLAVGTTSAAAKLHVRNGAIRLENSTDAKNWEINYDATANYFFVDEYGTARHLIINNGGSIMMPQVYNTVIGATNRNLRIDNTGLIGWDGSSIRYKKDVRDMENIEWLYDLRPVNFVYKTDSLNTKKYGFIAEEVDQVNKAFVSYDQNGNPETVNYTDLIAPMIKAIQDQQKLIEEQQKQLENLSTENSNLKKYAVLIEELNRRYDLLLHLSKASASN